MKKTLNTVLFLGLSLLGLKASAQTNSVKLKDGNGTTIGSYNSITNAYAAIPATLTQAYTIEIDSSYHQANETFPITFVAKQGASSSNTITLKPANNVTLKTLHSDASLNSLFVFDDADWINIDGHYTAPGADTEFGLNLISSSNTPNKALIDFKNGACHNTISNCRIANNGTMSGSNIINGIGIYFDQTTNPTGNSYNTINRCFFYDVSVPVMSYGDPNYPNNKLRFYGNEFLALENAISLLRGTSNAAIDSNLITIGTTLNPTVMGLDVRAISDTISITRNTIYIPSLPNMPQKQAYGINIGGITAPNNYIFIANNFISTQESVTVTNGVNYHLPDSITTEVGIAIQMGGGAIKADVYNNTIRIRNSLIAGGTSGTLASAAFSRYEQDAGSVYNIKNNLFINDRIGGVNGTQHVAISLANNNGTLNLDYNTYHSANGQLANYIGTVMLTMADYTTALGNGREANGNDSTVFFESWQDAHLTIADLNKSGLVGTTITGITTDIDNQQRTVPYRGADELVPCSNSSMPIVAVNDTIVCPSTQVALTATIPGITQGLVYQWESRPVGGGSYTAIPGATSTTYTATINQPMEFRLTDYCALGGNPVASDGVVVNLKPGATVTGISQTHTGTTYTFSFTNPQHVTSYKWLFGDGNTDTAANPTYTYAAVVANYNVQLVIKNECGIADTVSLPVNIVGCTTPVAATITGTHIFCDSAHLTLVANVTDTTVGNKYMWQVRPVGTTAFTDVDTTKTLNVTLYPAAQNWEYRFVGTCLLTNTSTVSTDTFLVELYKTPNLNVGITVQQAANVYSFSAPVHYQSNYHWSFGDGLTDTAKSPQHTYATSGTYTVQLIVNNGCGADTANTTLVYVAPCTTPAAATITGTSIFCDSAHLTLVPTGLDNTYGNTYQWQGRIGSTGTFTDIDTTKTLNLILYPSIKNWEFRFIETCQLTNTSTVSADTFVVEIYKTPNLSAGITATQTVSGYSFSAPLHYLSQYHWDFGDGTTDTDRSPSHDYTTSGTYTVQLIVTNGCGSDTATMTLLADLCANPIGGTLTANNNHMCDSGTVTLTATGYGKSVSTAYQWQQRAKGSNAAFVNCPNGYFLLAGNSLSYTTHIDGSTEFRLMDSCTLSGNKAYSDTVEVLILKSPRIDSITYTVNNADYTFGLTGDVDSVSTNWIFGDSYSSNQNNPTHKYEGSGTYTVIVTAKNRCGTDTATMELNVAQDMSVGNIASQDRQITLFPNPAKNTCTIRNTGKLIAIKEVKLINAVGQAIKTIKSNNDNEMSFDISGIATGYYIVSISTENGTIHLPLQVIE